MDFVLSHWHCIIPAAAIVIVLLVQNIGKKNGMAMNNIILTQTNVIKNMNV